MMYINTQQDREYLLSKIDINPMLMSKFGHNMNKDHDNFVRVYQAIKYHLGYMYAYYFDDGYHNGSLELYHLPDVANEPLMALHPDFPRLTGEREIYNAIIDLYLQHDTYAMINLMNEPNNSMLYRDITFGFVLRHIDQGVFKKYKK